MRAKVNILYVDGSIDLGIPGTTMVILRKWKRGNVEDIILTIKKVTDTPDNSLWITLGKIYEVEITREIVVSETDGEAIRYAVKRYEELS